MIFTIWAVGNVDQKYDADADADAVMELTVHTKAANEWNSSTVFSLFGE